MLSYLNKIYLFLSVALYFIFIPKITNDYVMILIINLLIVFSYFTVIYSIYKYKIQKFDRMGLFIIVFVYSLIFVGLYNISSHFYNENYFIFSDSDAIMYHDVGIIMSKMKFFESIDYFLNSTRYSFDDLGMPIIVSSLYKFFTHSNIIINIFYILVGSLTALCIFSISKNIMSLKYAYITALSYSLTSFVMLFHTTGLKESFMVFLIVLFFDQYFKYSKKRNVINLSLIISTLLLLILFRPVVSIFLVSSISLGYLIANKKKITAKIVFLLIFIILLLSLESLISILNRYLAGGFELLIAARESQGSIIGSLPFTYSVNVLSQAIGPLPSIYSSNNLITISSQGLIYRVLLAFPFWIGVVYIYKLQYYKIYPLVFFTIMEMVSLSLVMAGIELRMSMPHIVIVFIIAFWFLDKYDQNLIKFKKPKRFKQYFKVSILIVVFLIFYWQLK